MGLKEYASPKLCLAKTLRFNNQQTVSVIIPAYNEAAHIEKTLNYLQPYRNIYIREIIVADDGSTDGTPLLAQPLCDKVLHPNSSEPWGPAAARNRGAKVAKADLLFFHDADVQLEKPDLFFEQMLKAMSDHDCCGFSCALGIFPNQARLLERLVLAVQNGVMMLENALGIAAAGGWCQVFPRDKFLQAGGYNEALLMSQDLELFRRMARKGRVIYNGKLRVLETPRRYRRDGLCRTIWRRLLNSAVIMVSGKSLNYDHHRNVRSRND